MKFEEIIENFEQKFRKVKRTEKNQINQCSKIIAASRKTLSKLSNDVSVTCFINEFDEIHFFKHIKSIPLSNLILYTEIKSLGLKYPKIGLEQQKKFLQQEMELINKFFYDNLEFVNYVLENKTHLDIIYFTRKNYKYLDHTKIKQYYQAPEFSTSHDFLYSKVKAFQNLIHHVELKYMELINSKSILKSSQCKSPLKWTSSKVALTELIYALHSSGAVNSGAIDIKELAKMSELFFNVKLGDYYRTYLEIKMRKSSRTKFIDNLKLSLVEKMEESED